MKANFLIEFFFIVVKEIIAENFETVYRERNKVKGKGSRNME
jgi:hypothetical protein